MLSFDLAHRLRTVYDCNLGHLPDTLDTASVFA